MIEKFIKSENRNIEQLFHGDIVKNKASKYGYSKNEILDFSTNINPLGPPDSVLEFLRGKLGEISKYPPHEPLDLRRKLANYSGVSEEEIVLGNGSNDLIYFLARVFLKESDEVLISEPTFTEYSRAALMEGADVENVKLESDDNFEFSFEKFRDKISKDTKIVFLCSPNNPTGRRVPLKVLKNIVNICEDYGAITVLDEVFFEYTDSGRKYDIVDYDFNNLISLRSFTKFYSLPGLRIGYLIAPASTARILRRLKVRWNVNILAQLAAKKVTELDNFISKSLNSAEEGKEILYERLEKFSGLKAYPSSANFILLNLEKSKIFASELVDKLLKRGIAVRNCNDFKYLDDNFIRINARPPKDCEKLIKNLEDINSSDILEKEN